MNPQSNQSTPDTVPQQAGPPPVALQQVVASTAGQSSGLSTTSLVLGIIAFCTGFIGIGILIGLVAVIVGILALSRQSGGKGMAIAGISLGGVTLVLGGVIFAIVMTTYSGIQERSKTTANQAAAASVIKKAEAFNAENGTTEGDKYPTYDELMIATGVSELDPETKSKLSEGTVRDVSKDKQLMYAGCTAGATVFYWDVSDEVAKQAPYIAGSPDQC